MKVEQYSQKRIKQLTDEKRLKEKIVRIDYLKIAIERK